MRLEDEANCSLAVVLRIQGVSRNGNRSGDMADDDALCTLCTLHHPAIISTLVGCAAALIELHSYSSPSSVLSRRCYQAVTHRRGLEAKFEHLTHRHILTALATYLPLLICRLTD